MESDGETNISEINPILDLSDTEFERDGYKEMNEIEQTLKIARSSFASENFIPDIKDHNSGNPSKSPFNSSKTKNELFSMKRKLDKIQNDIARNSDKRSSRNKGDKQLLTRLQILKDDFEDIISLYDPNQYSDKEETSAVSEPKRQENIAFNYNIKVENNTKIYTIGNYDSDNENNEGTPKLHINIDDIESDNQNSGRDRYNKPTSISAKKSTQKKLLINTFQETKNRRLKKHRVNSRNTLNKKQIFTEKASKNPSAKMCQHYRVVDLSNSEEKKKASRKRKVNSRSLSKNSYFTNLQQKYQGKNKSTLKNTARVRKIPMKSEKDLHHQGLDFATKRFNYKKSKILENNKRAPQSPKNTAKINRRKRSPRLVDIRAKRTDSGSKIPRLNLFNKRNTTKAFSSSAKKAISSINKTFNRKKSPIRNLKYLTDTNTNSILRSETKSHSKAARNAFKQNTKGLKTQRPVKKINVDLELMPQLLTYEGEDKEELDMDQVLNISQSSTTEFNVLSSSSEGPNNIVEEKPAVDPLHNLQKKMVKRINFLFD
ncbi:unnamed protein product [Moneuplotes crassus]|uniref:Uncharacterized protein n=1 Tax=Euplotes crassus TaxID=5936 RepID=A0AAD2D7D8_EUPCR|nr:unnamed protein product [Moneuplotes crassus]